MKIPSNLQYKSHLSRQLNCWSLRCSWSIACRRCSNYIFILHLTHGFNVLCKDNCKPILKAFKLWDLVRLILEILWYLKVLNLHFSLDQTSPQMGYKRIGLKYSTPGNYAIKPGLQNAQLVHIPHSSPARGWISLSANAYLASCLIAINIITAQEYNQAIRRPMN